LFTRLFCVVYPVAYLAAPLFPDELVVADSYGRLPIHYAAARLWHMWAYDHPAQRLLAFETLDVLRVAIKVSPHSSARVADCDNRIVLHVFVDTFVKACKLATRATKENVMKAMLQILHELLRLYPESLQRRDGVTKLYPFLQAAAMVTNIHTGTGIHDELHLTILYELLRENPSLIGTSTIL
jgi:hypothetical protein